MPTTGSPKFRERDTARARELRQQRSPAEQRLWNILSRRQLDGWHFTRQYQIGPYFVDFLCRKARLVVEVDGYSHDMRQSQDVARDRFITREGYRIVRFSNDAVTNTLEGVALQILEILSTMPSPNPSREREGR